MKFLGNDKRVIGSFQLDDYQADAIRDIYKSSYDILEKGNKEQVLLHSPVGSGKTVMGAFAVNFFKRQMSELGYNEPISFIWISPDTGGINEQSKDSFLNMLEDVDVLDIQQGKTEKKIPQDTILFVNWEKLTVSGNLMKEETEQIVFKDIMDNTNTKKVLIIDEAHINWATDKNSEDSKVLQMIDADLIINLTATPDKRLLERVDKDNIIYISYKTVQDAGVIKDRVIINDGLDEDVEYQEEETRTGTKQIPLLDIEQVLLEKAIEKREYLEVLSKHLNKDKYLKPLVLIQIPNANALETVSMEYVYDFLISKGINKDEIGIWLANTKENIDDLNNSNVKYLITKQAVSTGWDCPRAHVLVKLRETGSINFDIQTIGRVMRMPRGLDYTNVDLKSAYIYTPHESFEYRGNMSESEKHSIDELTEVQTEANLKSSFLEEIGSMGVPMYKRVRTKDVFISNDSLYEFLNKEIQKGNFNFNKSATIEIKATETIEGMDIDRNLALKDSVIRKELTVRELKTRYMRNIAGVYNIVNLEPYVSNIMFDILLKEDNSIEYLSYVSAYESIYRLFYNNQDAILSNIKNGIRSYERHDNILQTLEDDYTIQEKVYLGQIKSNTNDKYSYDKEPDLSKDSKPEEKFQVFLNNNDNIKYWFKNGLGANDFSVVYEDDNMLREYYPDFIVFDYHNNIYILDTKSDFGDNDFDDTEDKYLAGLSYINKENVKEKFKNAGFENLIFSMIKHVKGGNTPFILGKNNYSNNINDWEIFDVEKRKDEKILEIIK